MGETETPASPAQPSAEATAAAKWWADKLRHGANLDNGDRSDMGGMTMMMALLAQDASRRSQNLSEDKVGVFESALSSSIDDMLERDGVLVGVIVHVDYFADETLNAAAAAAGITLDMTLLPWKTTMYIKKDKIMVYVSGGSPKEIPIA